MCNSIPVASYLVYDHGCAALGQFCQDIGFAEMRSQLSDFPANQTWRQNMFILIVQPVV